MILILFVFSSITAEALLYSSLLTVETNQKNFKPNENIHLSGKISDDILDVKIPVVLYVFDPLGNIFLNETLHVSNNTPNYNHHFEFDNSSLMGTYQLLVEYKEITDVTFIHLGTNPDNNHNKTAVIKYNEKIYPIKYWLSENATLDKIGIIPNSESILFLVNTNSTQSNFQVAIPRILYDFKDDPSFIILRGGLGGNLGIADDIQVNSDEKNYVLKIPLIDNAMNSIIMQIADHKYNKQLYVSPLKQFKSGILISEIKCKESLILITKHDGSPACVKSDSKLKLIEYGWAKSP